MSRLRAEASHLIEAAPQDVYAVFSDYHTAHPAILPKAYFPKIEVLEGGQGAGTRVKVTTKALGSERIYDLDVTEPEPGRRLVETDRLTGLVTTFLVEPGTSAQQSRVTIASEWEPQPGLAGLIEKWLFPFFMRRIYAEELGNVAQYLATKSSQR